MRQTRPAGVILQTSILRHSIAVRSIKDAAFAALLTPAFAVRADAPDDPTNPTPSANTPANTIFFMFSSPVYIGLRPDAADPSDAKTQRR